jgi:hypothetical protein
MALGADHVLINSRFELAIAKGPMRVMAVRAFHQAFVDLVMERLTECRLDIAMTTEAELWLRSPEQVRILARLLPGSRTPLQRVAYARIRLHHP